MVRPQTPPVQSQPIPLNPGYKVGNRLHYPNLARNNIIYDPQGGFSNRLGEAADTGAVKEVADLGGRPRSLEFGEESWHV